MIVSMGGNDVSNYDGKLKNKLLQKKAANATPTKRNRHMLNFDQDADMECEFDDIKDASERYTQEFNYQDQWFEFDEQTQSLTQTIVQQHSETIYNEASDSCC